METPGLTLRSLLPELAELGVVLSYYEAWHFFATEGNSFKKSLRAAEQDRPDVAFRRDRWKKHQGKIDPAK